MVYRCFQLRTTHTHTGAGSGINLQFCTLTAPPVPPSPVTNISASSTQVQRSDDGLVTFDIQWSKPEILNGNASIGPTYRLWIGSIVLDPMAKISDNINSRLKFVPDTQVSVGIYAEFCMA